MSALARFAAPAAAALLATALLAACGGDSTPTNDLPSGVTTQSITVYPATSTGGGSTAATQDLLTGGLGKSGIGAAAAPAYADPLNPTAAELRRNAIYSNYRGLVDYTANGGYGVFYGPNVDISGVATSSEGLIPGREYLAFLDDGSGKKRTTIAIMVPDSFNKAAACIVLGPSSGSRGVYGAIATSGEWGLKHGCAVALTDAGKGLGLYDPTDDSVNRIDGTRATRTAAAASSNYAADITDAQRTTFNAATPNRLSLKQAHSQQNPERDWGLDTIVAGRYAFYVLNSIYGTSDNVAPLNIVNTIVIAGSVSNGGAAVLRAAELDSGGLIDGVVAGEPVAEMPTSTGYGITFAGAAVTTFGKQLIDFSTYGNVYQPCAALSAPATIAEISIFNYIPTFGFTARAQARCAGLAAKGLVSGADLAAQSLDALNKLRSYGYTTLNDQMHNSLWALGNGPILSSMYPMMYGRFSLLDNVCNTSFAAIDASGNPVAIGAAAKAQAFATGNGTANGTPLTPIHNTSVGGAKSWQFAVSPSTNVADFGLDYALCQRALVTGVDETGAALTTTATSTRPTLAQSTAVRAGIAEVQLNGNVGGKPILIVAGRNDALVPVNNNARAYTAYNKTREGTASRVGYIEVANAQHFDAFIPFSGFDTRYVPLHLYFVRAMDAMYANLRSGVALPASQVVRATPRGGTPGAAPALTVTNVPAISAAPAAADQITFSGTSIVVPN